ncbi:hypothetical protein IC757_12625 [Wenzhouxiangella sp. AB-CW3]|uniref:hypothetical protein n=1 Tax=Wenzhouxiangella sp. AB-CW3 TaxID=2771012 RepID=UPI00168AA5AA|nr:hypothetical protein [Wenzhouxiangella sp. AB-CW3]QOC21866.1 hypothetical protein IC757_12625 [Wenzhouxiangella sp. AB-CW3]
MKRSLLWLAPLYLLAACATSPDCSPQGGFAQALADQTTHPDCRSEQYEEAFRLGEALSLKRREKSQLLEREDSLDSAERARLRSLERDIPELETLARMQGYLPPEQTPETGRQP